MSLGPEMKGYGPVSPGRDLDGTSPLQSPYHRSARTTVFGRNGDQTPRETSFHNRGGSGPGLSKVFRLSIRSTVSMYVNLKEKTLQVKKLNNF